MYDTRNSLVLTKAFRLYKSMLFLYPEMYRKKFGQEMLITFDDMYQEKIAKDGEIGILFWGAMCLDIAKSAIEQHNNTFKKQGMKKYLQQTLHVNRYNGIGLLLLLPFLTVFVIDLLARILQGDLTRYNRPVYAYLSHSPLYWTPVLFVWVVLFPAMAVLINLIPLVKNSIKKHHSIFHFAFLRQNILSLIILTIGFGFLALIRLHDFVPCFVHGLLKVGIGQLPRIMSVCSNA